MISLIIDVGVCGFKTRDIKIKGTIQKTIVFYNSPVNCLNKSINTRKKSVGN